MPKNKYGRPKKRIICQEEVEIFLNNLGFKAELINQEWRHLLAFGKYRNKDAVFKLASTQTTSSGTQNEYYWNEAVHVIPENKRNDFTVPQNYSSGYYGKLFYFISQRFLGKPLGESNSNDLKRAISRISQIARVAYEIKNLTIPQDCTFAKRKNNKVISAGHQLLQSATEWANHVPKDLSAFLEVIDKSKDVLRTSVGHGDFVVRQMFEIDGKIGIIDGEHAGLEGPLYYDVAQFYVRFRNDYGEKNNARQFLVEFGKLLPASDNQSFWDELKPVLIQRYIGDLWGASKNLQKMEELEPLGIEILENRIL